MIEDTATQTRPAPAASVFALSPGQRRLWLAEQLERSPAYNVPLALDLIGPLDARALQRAFRALVWRHEALRTSVVLVDGEPHQAVWERFEPDLRAETISEAGLAARLATLAATPFDLVAGPPLRAHLLHWAQERGTLLLVVHHLLCDGWSVGLLLSDLRALYAAAAGAGPRPGPAPTLQYPDYSEWLREQPDRPQDVAHWDERFATVPPPLAVHAIEGPGRSTSAGVIYGELPPELMSGVARFAQAERSSPFFVLLTAYALLLARRGAVDDLTIAVPAANRTVADFEQTVGFFVNTLALRLQLPAGLPLRGSLSAVQHSALADLDHQGYPYEKVLARARARHGEHLTDLAGVMFAYQNAPFSIEPWPGLDVAARHVENGGAKADLVLRVDPWLGGGARAILEYRTSSFRAEDARALLESFTAHVRALVTTPSLSAAAIPLLAGHARGAAIAAAVGVGAVAERPTDLARWFTGVAARQGSRTAVTWADAQVTYAELERRSAAVARRLGQHGIGAEVRVGLACTRGLDLLVGVLGILRAGAAYVPLDPAYPQARLAYIVADSSVRLVLADDAGSSALAGLDVPVLEFTEHARPAAAAGPNGAALPAIDPDQAAYVIYTSGSTGEPKGCVVTHRNVTRLLAACEGWLAPGADDVWTLFHSYAFDFSVWEMWGALLYGGRLVVVPHDVARDPAAFLELLAAERVSVLCQTPSAFRQLAAAEAQRPEPARLALRWVVFGGEALEPATLAGWRRRHPTAPRLMNMYGITETTVHVTTRELGAAEIFEGAPSLLGHALGDLRMAVLDERLEPLPHGAVGELCVGGAGVARGYLGRPALTAARFLPDPYGPPGSRLYRSGDLARRRADGDVEYLGRADHQVKIRGFRVELGEIEAALAAHQRVADAAVLALPGPDGPRLVAWVVGRDGPAEPAALRAWLVTRLPEHLLPAAIVPLERLPLTANGKLDRAALPAPQTSGHVQAGVAAGAAPQGPTEERLARIWAEVLNLPPGSAVGRDDHFFASGGDSIVALRLVAAAKRAGLALQARDVFQSPTLAGLARAALGSGPQDAAPAQTHEPRLTPIEQWFFELELPHRAQWAQAVELHLRGDIDRARVEAALDALVARHPVFALRFRHGGGGWEAAHDAASPRLARRVFPAGSPLAAVAAELLVSLDLERGPLAALGWIGAHDAVLAIHHLAVDTASWHVLQADLADALAGRAVAPPTAGRAAWRDALLARARGADTAYWEAQLGALRELPHLPAREPGPGRYADVARRDHTVAASTAAALAAASSAGTPADELVLAAALLALADASGSPRVGVTLERHGRDAVALDTSHSVGWHTALAPFLVSLPADTAPARALGVVTEALCRWAPRAADYLTLRACADPPLRAALHEHGLPEVAFNFLGKLDAAPDAAVTATPVPDVPLHDPSGTRPFAHEIVAWTDAAGLHLTWLFNGRAVDGTTVGRWLARLEAHLARLAPEAAAGKLELPATPLQQGLIFHTINDLAPSTYLQQVTAELRGDVDPEALRAAWQHVLRRHDALSAAFTSREDGSLVQRLDPDARIPFQQLDLGGLASDAQAELLRAHLQADRRKGIALDHAPLMRLTLARLDEQRWWLAWTHHHAIVDGWSLPLVLETFLGAYHAVRAGHVPTLPPAPSSTRYVRWRLGEDERALAAAWHTNLAALEGPCRLRLPLPDGPASGTQTLTLALPEALADALGAVAHRTGTTLNSVFLAAWALVVRLLAGDDRVVLGVTLSGRHADVPGIDQMVGLFINTVPLALRAAPQLPASTWIGEVQRALGGAQDVAHAGLGDIQRWVGHSGEALFDTLYVFENYPTLERPADAALGVRDVEMHEQAHYPLVAAVVPGPPLRVRLAYDRGRIDPVTAAGIMETYQALLAGIAADPQRALGTLPALGTEAATTVERWSSSADPAAAPRSGAALFAHAVAHHPDRVALDDGTRRITYRALARSADALARRLQARGLGQGPHADTVVGVCLRKSVLSIAAQLALWKLGAAFLPLDPTHPAERRAECLQAAGARAVLLDATTLGTGGLTPEIALAHDDADDDGAPPLPLPALGPEALAYVIFTSGSTGAPKGVAVSHRGLANLYEGQRDAAGVRADDRLFQFASAAFDAAIAELLMALARGATLVLPPPDQGFADVDVAALLRASGTTNVTLPPALLAVLEPASLPAVRTLLVAGDAASGALFRAWSRGRRVFNAYGPTEATVCASIHDCTHVAGEPTLGAPMRGAEMHVLGPDLQPLPPGVPGEIFLGGVGLARGYLRQPALTASAFVPHPANPGARLYRTGDRGAWTARGEVRYLGRIDRQVKLRGFRLELAEVEAALVAQPGVAHAVVVLDGEERVARLLGFVQGLAGTAPATGALREALARTLPHYMVPATLHPVADWPRTANGKVDRAALLALAAAAQRERTPATRAAIDDPLARMLAGLWAGVLRHPAVGADDNFFDLGGDSISALQIASRARQAGHSLLPRDVLECQTVAALADRIRAQAAAPAAPDADPAPRGADAPTGEPAPLLPAQHWFFEQIDVAPERWLLSVELIPNAALDPVALQRALEALVATHEALRLTYSPTGMTTCHGDSDPRVDRLHVLAAVPGETPSERCVRLEQMKGTIDPFAGPVFALCLVQGAEPRLLFAVHHLAADAVGLRVLLDDLWTAYEQARRGEPVRLAPSGLGGYAYAVRLAAVTRHGAFDREVPYWQTVLRRDLPLAIRSVAEPTRQGDTVRRRASVPLSPGVSGADVEPALLAALYELLAGQGGAALLVEREGHGRAGLPGVDLTRAVGWFTAIHPMRLERADPAHVKALLADIPSGGVGYGALVHLADRDDLRAGYECWIAVNYLGTLSEPDAAPLRIAADAAGGDQDPRQRRARPLAVEARRTGDELVVEWIADARLALGPSELVAAHAEMTQRLLSTRNEPAAQSQPAGAFSLDADEMAALLDDLSSMVGSRGDR